MSRPLRQVSGKELLRLEDGTRIECEMLNAIPTIDNTYIANRVASLDDVGRFNFMNLAGANTFTVSQVSVVAWKTGALLAVVQEGAGATTIVAGTGVTILANVGGDLVTITAGNSLALSGQLSAVFLRHRGANVWHAFGQPAEV